MSKVKSYVRTKKFEFEVAVDPNSQIKKKMKVLQMPTTILVDQSGEIIFRHQGYLPGDEHDILKEIYETNRFSTPEEVIRVKYTKRDEK